jgi:Tol biopolymer transport system component
MHKQLTRTVLSACAAFALTGALVAQVTTRQSVDLTSTEADGPSDWSSVSGFDGPSGTPGRYVAFASSATNLVSPVTSGRRQVYRKDRVTGAVVLVSVGMGGLEGDSQADRPVISADGNLVVFESDSTDLVTGTFTGRWQIFVRDILAGTTIHVSESAPGVECNRSCFFPAISADGSTVVYHSKATNIVGSPTGQFNQIYRYDIGSGTTAMISDALAGVGTGGNGNSQFPWLSGDGELCSYQSRATDLVASDTNGAINDAFLYDHGTGLKTIVSVVTGGLVQGNSNSTMPRVSADGTAVVFQSIANNLGPPDLNFAFDVFHHDIGTVTTTRVSLDTGGGDSNGNSAQASCSNDGNFIVFHSVASDLVAGDGNGVQDVFLHDFSASTTIRVSASTAGVEGDLLSQRASVTDDGNSVVYDSLATNLIGAGVDGNGTSDVFLHDRTPTFIGYCTGKITSCQLAAATITGSGTPSATASSGFTIEGLNANTNRPGLVIYSNLGRRVPAIPFPPSNPNALLCIESVRRAIPLQSSVGTPGTCDSVFTMDFNAFARGLLGGNPGAFLDTPGQQVVAQWWGRDTQAWGVYLTNGLEFWMLP